MSLSNLGRLVSRLVELGDPHRGFFPVGPRRLALFITELRSFGSAGQPQPRLDRQHSKDPDEASSSPAAPAPDTDEGKVKAADDGEHPDNDNGGEYVNKETGEIGGPRGPEPTRFGDWERGGRCSDF